MLYRFRQNSRLKQCYSRIAIESEDDFTLVAFNNFDRCMGQLPNFRFPKLWDNTQHRNQGLLETFVNAFATAAISEVKGVSYHRPDFYLDGKTLTQSETMRCFRQRRKKDLELHNDTVSQEAQAGPSNIALEPVRETPKSLRDPR